VQSSVYATVTANGNTYNTNTSSVSITPPTMSINGSDAICSGSSSYHVDGLPCNSTVVWSVSPLGVVAFDPDANPVTLTPTPTGNGVITVTATVSNVCGGNPIVISKPNITVGAPTSIGVNVGAGGYTNMEDCGDATGFKVLYNAANHNYSGNFYVTASNASLSWTEVSNSSIPYWGWTTSNNGQTLSVSQKFANKYFSLKVTATNGCGSINKIYTFGSDVCPFSVESIGVGDNYLLAPNPAENNFSVSVNTAGKSSETVSFTQIRIYDGTGDLKKQIKYESGTRQAQINITDLRPGYYYVEISNGKTSIRKLLVVQR